jgi:hypothetical protein
MKSTGLSVWTFQTQICTIAPTQKGGVTCDGCKWPKMGFQGRCRPTGAQICNLHNHPSGAEKVMVFQII